MKKIINRLFCALILLCAVGFLGGCKQEPETNSSPSIVGTWVCNEEVAPNKLVFLDSGFVTFYLYGTVLATGTYSVTGNSAKIYTSGYDANGNGMDCIFTAKFGDTTLTLSVDYGDGPNSTTYVKV